MGFPDTETIFLVEEPDADRRYVWKTMTSEYFQKLKARGARVLKVVIPVATEVKWDQTLTVSPTEVQSVTD